MKILVTGSNGFIGKRFCNKLKSEGHKVVKFDLPKRNILNRVDIRMVVDSCDMVVHFAAMADLNKSIDFLFDNFNTNVFGTLNVALIAREYEKPMIFCSTCCVYGNHSDKIAIEEKTLPACVEPYARSKVAAENVVIGMPGLQWMIIRPGTVYGPGMRDSLFTQIAFDKIINGKDIDIHGTGKQNRRFIHVDDLVNAFYLATQKFRTKSIINACGNKKYSVLDVVKIVENIVGKKARLKFVDDRYGQTFNENISIKNAEKLLCWKPEIDFYDGMRDYYNYGGVF